VSAPATRGFAAIVPGGSGVVRIQGCRSCGAGVLWARTERSWMILDEHPKPEGRFVIDVGGGEIRCRSVDPSTASSERYCFVPHWATCVDANRWRRKGGSADKA
jgi:hypothetical protein